jgi:hypothetical protein
MICCEDCDRDVVVKSFCYFTRNQYLFYDSTGYVFTLENFAVFAVEVQLRWKILTCPYVPRAELVFYWNMLRPYLVETYRAHKHGTPPDMSKIYMDYILFICDTWDSE